MGKCDYCGKEVALPYKCPYCGGHFCSEHHLPENHDCPGLKKKNINSPWFIMPYPTRRIWTEEKENKSGHIPSLRINKPRSSYSSSLGYDYRNSDSWKIIRAIAVVLVVVAISVYIYGQIYMNTPSNISINIPTLFREFDTDKAKQEVYILLRKINPYLTYDKFLETYAYLPCKKSVDIDIGHYDWDRRSVEMLHYYSKVGEVIFCIYSVSGDRLNIDEKDFAQQAVEGWENSPEHHMIIHDLSFNRVGITVISNGHRICVVADYGEKG